MAKFIRTRMMEIRRMLDMIGFLEKQLLNGEITEEEYKKKKAWYVETLLELYCRDIITEEELKERLNK
jgi:hypothetical protein